MNLHDWLFSQTRTADFRQQALEMLLQICSIDTSPNPDPDQMRRAEAAVFEVLEAAVAGADLPGMRLERRPIDPGIAQHPAFSLLHQTKTSARPDGLSAEQTYAGRANLVVVVPGQADAPADAGLAVNAHIDVVAPFVAPRLEANRVHGRGSCDDKGSIVAMTLALRLIGELSRQFGLPVPHNLVWMYVIEEETGGNGSLALARDREIKQFYDRMLVLECTGNRIHPANRGAVWYKTELRCPGVNSVEMAAYVVEAMEKEGRSLRAESRHELFPQRPVQTCHGMLGPYGEHPSRICGRVAYMLELSQVRQAVLEPLIRDVLDAALAEYCGVYGDKTNIIDPTTGKPKLDHHYDLEPVEQGLRLTVHGTTGHMGSILENDGALTKAATMVRALVASRSHLEGLSISLVGHDDPHALSMEGGQGFVPTHTLEEVTSRVAAAAQHGASCYLRRIGHPQPDAKVVHTSFDKLHNAAFDGDPQSPTMTAALQAAEACGITHNGPITGWTVSCDARLFASEYPAMPVLTFGPGHLAQAHADHEYVDIDDLIRAVEFITLFAFKS